MGQSLDDLPLLREACKQLLNTQAVPEPGLLNDNVPWVKLRARHMARCYANTGTAQINFLLS